MPCTLWPATLNHQRLAWLRKAGWALNSLPVENALPYVGHSSFHVGLVFGMTQPVGIDKEAPMLGVSQETPRRFGTLGVGPGHRRRDVVGPGSEATPETKPRRLPALLLHPPRTVT